MFGQKTLRIGIAIAIVMILATACSPVDREQAAETLKSFFERLSTGDYAGAAELYGGSYETLASWNPEIPASDTASLWQNGCQINGLNCLGVRSAEPAGQEGDVFVFTVEFSNPDGSLFIQGPCCGADATQMPPVSQFQVHVQKTPQGDFLVLDMPVYTP